MKRAVEENVLELMIPGTTLESQLSPVARGQLWASLHRLGVMKE
jgi:hypothetical protein